MMRQCCVVTLQILFSSPLQLPTAQAGLRNFHPEVHTGSTVSLWSSFTFSSVEHLYPSGDTGSWRWLERSCPKATTRAWCGTWKSTDTGKVRLSHVLKADFCDWGMLHVGGRWYRVFSRLWLCRDVRISTDLFVALPQLDYMLEKGSQEYEEPLYVLSLLSSFLSVVWFFLSYAVFFQAKSKRRGKWNSTLPPRWT